MPAGLHVVRAGTGPRLLLIHGSAADHTTWTIQLASALPRQFTLIAYDRRVHGSVETHADDAIGLLAGEPHPALVIGSSFGAVIALEVVRRGAVAGAILIEPPMGASDAAPAAPAAFLEAYDRVTREQGGPAAAALFLRTVLGDPAFERMPQVYRERAMAKWVEIRADSEALIAYRPRYGELVHVTAPVLLVGGDRSAAYFRPTLDALHAALPGSERATVAHAGHMLHAEAHRRFAELVVAFAARALPPR